MRPVAREFKQLVQHHADLNGHQPHQAQDHGPVPRAGIILHTPSRSPRRAAREALARLSSAPLRAALGQLTRCVTEPGGARAASQLEIRRPLVTGKVKLLQTIPGVGRYNAARFRAYVQTPQRFSNRRKLWRYCGSGSASAVAMEAALASATRRERMRTTEGRRP